MIEIRDRPEHVNNTLIPESMTRPNRPWVVPSVQDGNLRTRCFDERENAMAYIASWDELNRLYPQDFDRKFPSWMMGLGKQ